MRDYAVNAGAGQHDVMLLRPRVTLIYNIFTHVYSRSDGELMTAES